MPRRGWIFFDATCGLCSESVRRWEKSLTKAGFDLIPLQSIQAEQMLNLPPKQTPNEIKLVTTQGQMLGGIEALAYLARYVWWAFPFHLVMKETFFRFLMVEIYQILAKHRRRISQTCGLKPLIPHN